MYREEEWLFVVLFLFRRRVVCFQFSKEMSECSMWNENTFSNRVFGLKWKEQWRNKEAVVISSHSAVSFSFTVALRKGKRHLFTFFAAGRDPSFSRFERWNPLWDCETLGKVLPQHGSSQACVTSLSHENFFFFYHPLEKPFKWETSITSASGRKPFSVCL